MSVIAAIDQGTSSTRCILFNEDGFPVSSSQKEHAQLYPKPGWVEHDPYEIIENCKWVIKESVRNSNFSLEDITAIGITNQRETFVLWNRVTGHTYGNAIVWQDTRSDSICTELINSRLNDIIQNITGLPIATYFSGPKLKWMLENTPNIQGDIEKNQVCFGTIDSWLLWNFNGGTNGGRHLTDVTNASRTMLMNIKTMEWDEQLLSLLNVPTQILPKIKSSNSDFGYLKIDNKSIPITAVLGDQQAALFGQTCFKPGSVKNTYGTGCFLLMNTGNNIVRSSFGLIATIGYKLENEAPVYCLEGSIAITGALVQWIRDNLGIINKSDEIEELASSVGDNGGLYFVPAFSGLFAPYWKPDARGLIIGLTRYATKNHLARAVLEATAFQTRDVVEAMANDSKIPITELKVDGGMVRNNILMQFQADILPAVLVKPLVNETTALGAAFAAGLYTGYWNNKEQLCATWAESQRWEPKMNSETRNLLYSRWKKAVERSFDWQDKLFVA